MSDRKEVNEADLDWLRERDQPLNDAIEKGYYDEEMNWHPEYTLADMEVSIPASPVCVCGVQNCPVHGVPKEFWGAK